MLKSVVGKRNSLIIINSDFKILLKRYFNDKYDGTINPLLGKSPKINLDKVDKITGVEPSEEMQKLAVNRIINMELDVNLITSDAADIPIDDNSIDTIVCTYTLCTVSRPLEVLQEMKRVLKKGGKFLLW